MYKFFNFRFLKSHQTSNLKNNRFLLTNLGFRTLCTSNNSLQNKNNNIDKILEDILNKLDSEKHTEEKNYIRNSYYPRYKLSKFDIEEQSEIAKALKTCPHFNENSPCLKLTSSTSNTPINNTTANLQNMITPHAKKFRRNPIKRVFVNRSVAMNKIKAIGFDMDYTLAVYKSPQYEELGFKLIIEQFLKMGYPREILNYQYDPTFISRGLLFDNQLGNLLKIDGHGNILVAAHGLRVLKPQEMRKSYPNKFIMKDDTSRFYIYNTLFNLPEIYLMACVVDMFESAPNAKILSNGIQVDDNLIITYKQLQKDVRGAVDCVHRGNDLKNQTVEDPHKYIARDDNLPILLDRMRESGKKLFLATNSGFAYSNKVMDYLFDVPSARGRNWKDFFDISIVDSRKPLFFEEGTLLRQVDIETGNTKLGRHMGKLVGGEVYSGGCSADITELIGCNGTQIMYIGDHIFGDILKSKKTLGWRTFLVVPELADELHVWREKKDSIRVLADLDDRIGEMLSSYDSSSKATELPDISNLQKTLRMVVHDMDMAYGKFGSLFRTGSRNTMFAGQVMRFADLYGSSFINLLHYPFSFLFRAEAQLLPHELSVANEQEAANIDTNNANEISEISEVQTETIMEKTTEIIEKRGSISHGTKSPIQEQISSSIDKTSQQLSNHCLNSRFKVLSAADVEEESPMITRSSEPEFWKRKTAFMSGEAGMTGSFHADLSQSTGGHQNIEYAGSDLGGSRPATPTYPTHDFDDDEDSDHEK